MTKSWYAGAVCLLLSFALIPALVASGQKPQIAMPTSVKVGPFTYRIQVSELVRHKNYWGITLCDENVIQLAPGMPEDRLREVLYHELQHTAYCTPEILKDAPEGATPSYTEEQAVYIMAPHMVAILRDNPLLVEWLTQQ